MDPPYVVCCVFFGRGGGDWRSGCVTGGGEGHRYYDEVVLGRCLHHFSGLACQRVPGMGWTTADALRPDLEERTGYPVLSVHPALPSDMARLRAAFSEAIDKKWVRRFHRDGLPEPVPFATTV